MSTCPQGVEFDFEYSAVAAHAVVLLGEDPRLGQMRSAPNCSTAE